MLRKGQIPFSSILMLVDAAVVFTSFMISFWLRFYSGLLPLTKGVPDLQPYIIGSVVVALLWILVFWMIGLYETRTRLTMDEEAYRVGKGTFVCVIAVTAFSFFYRDVAWSRLVLIMATAISFILVSLERVALVGLFHRWMTKNGYGIKQAALIGSGRTARGILEYVAQHPEYGYRITCLVSIEGLISSSRRGKNLPELLTVSGLDQLSQVIDQRNLDALFLVLPHELQPKLIDIVNSTEHRPVELKFVPDLIDIVTSNTKVTQLGDIPVIGLRELPLTAWDLLIKSIFDFTMALAGIIVISPLLLLLALLVKLTSSGSLIYSQERVGFDGKVFKMFKFRSMRIGAEEATGPVWAKANDERRTPIGAFLRKYSLDELPQLFNVLRGDMSLVGPRPERPFFVEKFTQQIPRYASRHRMKSGITGWAQVHGLRGATSIEERTLFDLEYVQNWSLLMDLKILIRTVLQVVFPTNAV